jgi:Protein of unknown function (DUF2796)
MTLRDSLTVLLAASASCVAVAAQAEDEHRQLGPHVHGHGTLAIAIEANDVLMELHAPGMDIVGFEHEADTPDQKALVDAARNDLQSGPLKLFVVPDSAGCKVTSSTVDVVAEEEDAGHEAEAQSMDGAEADEHADHHNEFRAAYALTCADTTKLTSMDFMFFDRFAGSQELDVTIVDANGQNAYEISRDSRRLERSAQ